MVRNDNFIFMKQKSINWSYELKFLMYYFNKKASYQKALPYCDTRNNSVLCPQICPISHKENVSISCVNSINRCIALTDFQEKEAFQLKNFKLYKQ
ncbi:hypothetical protein CDAR_482721, partial [Caerostris darwini]